MGVIPVVERGVGLDRTVRVIIITSFVLFLYCFLK